MKQQIHQRSTLPAQSNNQICGLFSLLNWIPPVFPDCNSSNGWTLQYVFIRSSFSFALYGGAVHRNSNVRHTWCAEQIPFSPWHVNRISLEKSRERTPHSALTNREKKLKQEKKYINRERERGGRVRVELCFPAETFDHFALMSSTQPFSFYRIPCCMFSVSWTTYRCAACI